jgi:signal transduction histidine kinase
MIEELRRVDLLADLSDEQLRPWAQAADHRMVAAGTILVEADAEPIGLVLLLKGTIEGLLRRHDEFEPEVDHVAPTWLGAIPTLLRGPSPIRMLARDELSVAVIAPTPMRALVRSEPAVFDRIMAQMRPVLGRFGEAERTRERLVSLGTMAAGLSHELNNPASAGRRAAAVLADSIDQLPLLVAGLLSGQVRVEDLTELPEVSQLVPRSALEIADAEDALLPALQELDVSEPWRLAAALAAAGVDAERARHLVSRSGPVMLEWLAFLTSSRQAAGELTAATSRVSELVAGMRDYTYLDRDTLIEIDVHDGIDATLTVLASQTSASRVTIQREYEPELPRIRAHGAELNQVWTKLIENALLASPGGTITVLTRLADGCIEVDVTDDGPGIPEEIRGRVFDPFFTTRDVGQGVGLALHAARRIVVSRHNGTLTVNSEPGQTTFRVRLPLDGAVPAPM